MPQYEYRCKHCENVQQQYKELKKLDSIGTVDKKLQCSECGKSGCMARIISSGIQVIDPSKIRLNGDPHKEAEYKKRAKDPERARKLRKAKFGTEGISITKSEFYHKEKRIKAKGSGDVDKKQFIQAAARNPNAFAAAKDALKRAGKKA